MAQLAPVALHDPERLEALRRTGLLDAPPVPALERLSRLAARLLQAPTAVVTLVDADRQFFASCLGLPEPWQSARETPLTHSFCQYLIEARVPLVVEDAREHSKLRDNLAIRDLGAIAYLGVPLATADGLTLGALAVLDGRPRAWTDADRELLEELAASVMTEIELRAEIRRGQEAVRALADREARFRTLSASAPLGIFETDEHRAVTYVNDRLAQLWGLPPAAFGAPGWLERVHPQDRPALLAALGEALASDAEPAVEYRVVTPDGDTRWLRAHSARRRDGAGQVLGLVCTVEDVTERRVADAALARSEARLAEAQRVAQIGSWERDLAADTVWWSAELYRLFGRDPALGPLPPDQFHTALHASHHAAFHRDVAEGLARWSSYERNYRVVRPDGTERVLRFCGEIQRHPDGRPCRVVGTAQDVSALVEATAALRASEQRFRDLVESAHEGVWVVDAVARTTYVNPRLAAILGYPADAVLGRDMFDFMEPAQAFEARTLFARRQRGIAERHEFTFRRADGAELLTTVSASPLRDADGAFAGALALVTDMTEQRRAEAALRDSQAGLRLALTAAGMVVWERDLATERLRNLAPLGDDVIPPVRPEAFGTYAGFLDAVHPEDRERVARAHADAVARVGEFSHQFRVTGAPGQLRWLHSTGRALAGEDGRAARMIGVSLDVTERVALEAQLRQAQKMEAVGQLAGGVAHDFNNLLTVITASTRFAREALPPDTPAGEDLASIDAAAERAAQLTRQLLAFSRQQLLKPQRLDPNAVVRGVKGMLRRLLGEDIEILGDFAAPLPPVLADPGQLEQVLLNLAVNARDAMPHGGRLVLQTAPVTVTADDALRRGVSIAPGAYVRISVRDTGTGMDAATLARLFEPFFTTKAPGKGTGLGLATVYGIVKQSGGYVWVTSTPGAGTTFDVDLPAATDNAGPAVTEDAQATNAGRGTETVLLVEDDMAVRAVTRRVLARQGYTVLEASHGAAALELLERHDGPVDLVLTDVVMPEMNGQAFAAEVTRRHPGLRVLFMSGYTDDEILRRGVLAPGMAFLEKPFTHETLLQAVRAALRPGGRG